MNSKLFSALFVLFLHVSLISQPSAEPVTLRCSDTPVAFRFDRAEDLRCLCKTAEETVRFLASIGLATSACTTIKLVRKINKPQAHNLAGVYDPAVQEVLVLTYPEAWARASGKQGSLGVELTEELWCSYAAHELAHAISQPYLNPEITAHTAAEYIAFVTQLSVLSTETRAKILETYPDIEAYSSVEEMSELYYLLDPNRFAVKSYLHFKSLQNPLQFIQQLLQQGNGH